MGTRLTLLPVGIIQLTYHQHTAPTERSSPLSTSIFTAPLHPSAQVAAPVHRDLDLRKRHLLAGLHTTGIEHIQRGVHDLRQADGARCCGADYRAAHREMGQADPIAYPARPVPQADIRQGTSKWGRRPSPLINSARGIIGERCWIDGLPRWR